MFLFTCIKLIVFLCQYHLLFGEEGKYIITFIASLTVALIILFANILWDKSKLRKEKRDKIRSEIYLLCEKIITHAIYANQNTLAAKYYYAMHKIDMDEDFDKMNYSKYLNDAENSALLVSLYRAELKLKIGELQIYWNRQYEINEIKGLMKKEGLIVFQKYDVFNKDMNKESVESKYNLEMANIVDFVKKKSGASYLIMIQEVLFPNLEK